MLSREAAHLLIADSWQQHTLETQHPIGLRERGMQEKCGILAIVYPGEIPPDLEQAIYNSLPFLEHRGNDGAGHLRVHARTGAWQSIHTAAPITELAHELLVVGADPATITFFHTRYKTTGDIDEENPSEGNTQPFVVANGPYKLALQHNGNIPAEYIAEVRAKLVHDTLPSGASDTRIMTAYLGQERLKYESWKDTFVHCLPEFKGAYSLVMMDENNNVYAARDPYGVRPLVYGKRLVEADDEQHAMYVIASESPSLEALGIPRADLKFIKPGVLYIFSTDGHTEPEEHPLGPGARCTLELMYFMREDSLFEDGKTVGEHREALGRGVAPLLREKGVAEKADMLVPVLYSGRRAAYGLAAELQKEVVEVMTRIQNIRSFTQASTEERQLVARNKHSISPDGRKLIAGKVVILVDDTYIRGISFLDVIAKARGRVSSLNGNGRFFTDDGEPIAQPKEIHVVLAAPPVIEICDLGIAIANRSELSARNLLTERYPELAAQLDDFRNLSPSQQATIHAAIEVVVAEYLDVDSVTFATHSVVKEALGTTEICMACLGGHHPIHHAEEFADAVTAFQLSRESAGAHPS